MLGRLGDECAVCAFFDSQYRGLLDRMGYSNEGERQRGRASLEQMDSEMVAAFVRELDRVVVKSGTSFCGSINSILLRMCRRGSQAPISTWSISSPGIRAGWAWAGARGTGLSTSLCSSANPCMPPARGETTQSLMFGRSASRRTTRIRSLLTCRRDSSARSLIQASPSLTLRREGIPCLRRACDVTATSSDAMCNSGRRQTMAADPSDVKMVSDDDVSEDDLVRVTVTMTMCQHRAIKRAARESGTTVSGLARVWMMGSPYE